jgi:hypothetical protein
MLQTKATFFNRLDIKKAKQKKEKVELTFTLTCSKQTLNKVIANLLLEEVYVWNLEVVR